jgi:hypothetical protein
MQKKPRLIDCARSDNRHLFLSGAVAFFCAQSALAQAWLAPKGEASFAVAYGNVYTRDHLFSEGERFDRGSIRMNVAIFGLTYSFTDRLAGSASLPYVVTRYEGAAPHAARVDDGEYHGSFTDLRLDLRYNLLREPLVVTPFVATIIPTRDYPTFAHAAPSSGLEQYVVGVAMGRRLDPILESGFAQLRYSYAFAEEVLGISHDRSNVDIELGYFLTQSLGVSATGSYQKTHGGLDLPAPGTPESAAFQRSPYFVHHDQLGQSNFLNVGGAVSYALTGTVDVFASYQTMVWGRNVHAIQPGLAFGLSWGFSPKRVIRSFAKRPATFDATTH